MSIKIPAHMNLFGRKILHHNKKSQRIAAFISIPKNGSHSVRKILELGKNRDEETTTSLVIYENHQRAEILNRKYNLNHLFVFCFARNPYDRCVSWYEYHKNLKPYRHLSFNAWIKEGMPHHFKRQNQTNYIAKQISPLLQYNFIEDYKVDFIGRMESFSLDIKSIIKKLNELCEVNHLKHRFHYTLKKENQSIRHTNYEKYYTFESKEIVYSLLEEDFVFFNYQK